MPGSLGLYGSPVGEIRFEEMLGQQAQTAHTLGQIAMQPAQMRMYEQHGDLYAAQAEEARAKANQEKLLAQIAQRSRGGAAPSGVSMADQLESLAEQAAGAGLVTKAGELAKTASLIRARDARTLASQATADKTNLDAVRTNADLVGRSFAEVKDQASFDAANRFYTFNTGAPSPYEEMTFSPELVARIRDNALSVKEQADIAERAARNRNRTEYEGARKKHFDAQQRVREARLTIERAREARLAKAGGGREVSGPATAEVDQAKKFIFKDYPGLEAADLKEAAYAVASDARLLRRQNRALSADEALRRAYMGAQQSGDFETTSAGIAGYGRKDVFKGGGKSAEAPARLPPDLARAVKDKFYINDTGVVAKYLGNGKFQVVGGGRPLSVDKGRPIDEDEEDEEEED